VHASSPVDPKSLDIKLWLNGELRQDSNTSKMLFDIPELIAQLSQGLTLLPGDILLTGTPHGVGYALQPPQCLKPGDEMKIEIQHIGTLVNRVI
jgi:2-keto-4-pentenoate hydratase/2-oxohepta-3-ene-1,7-dioic acid hydratase in catechol pathway